ncbi:hypothetical protein [Bdellovibrio bacteriovorus]|uniref:hypothetical protein n=1 Tax=Bdellovibrio bacteriovorus TaxID=959 RepID=UPI0035A6E968
MKILKSIVLVALSLSAVNASAYGLECTTQSHIMDFLTLDRDGGEETITVNYLSEQKERFLVIKHTRDHIVAVKGQVSESNPRKVELMLDESGNGQMALYGQTADISCTEK